MTAASIFICHAQADAAFAQALRIALETCRLQVWNDTHHLRGGDRLATEVRWAIEQARWVMVVLSLNTGDPAWLRREIEVAQEAERRRGNAYGVIPLLLPGVDDALLAEWFTPSPRITPIRLTTEGLGAALPDLLAALGEPPASDSATDRNPPAVAELVLTFSHLPAETEAPWQIAAVLNRPSDDGVSLQAATTFTLPIAPLTAKELCWYFQSYPCWPSDTTRELARRTDAALVTWGRMLYASILDTPPLRALTTAWRDSPKAHDWRLTLQTDSHPTDANIPTVRPILDLPWELLHDADGFLIQGKQPPRLCRQLPGGGEPFAPAPPPVRILVISPRPDTETTGHPDHRRTALPLLDALEPLGALVSVQILNPPSLAALDQRLNDAWATGQPFTALHFDGCFRPDPATGAVTFGFEETYDQRAPLCRDARFISAPALAALLNPYRIRLVTLTCADRETGATPAADLATTLLAAGLAAAIVVRDAVPAPTLQRFWATFYEELLRGASISQATFSGQRRLATDSYRMPGFGGSGVHLQDWFVPTLYQGRHDPQLCLRPPLELWRRLQSQPRPWRLGQLPDPPRNGSVGRSRELLILERLLEDHPAIFLHGPGDSGKTVVAVALARWLARCGRYRMMAYVRIENTSDVRALLEILGRQILPDGEHWSPAHYSTPRKALNHLRQILRQQPTLLIFDQLEHWAADHNDALSRFWEDLQHETPRLSLLAISRTAAPAFAQNWPALALGPLDEPDTITLLSRTLAMTDRMPLATDCGDEPRALHDLVELASGHPGALIRLAHAVSEAGVSAAAHQLRQLRAELRRRYPKDPQWPLYLSLELALRQLSPADRNRLTILALFNDGVHRIALGHALELDTATVDALSARLIALDLAEDQGYGHLRLDPALPLYLAGQLDEIRRAALLKRWRAGMDQLVNVLYPQYFKERVLTNRLLRLELPNLLALLRDRFTHSTPEQTALLISRLEPLLAGLHLPAALAEVVTMREQTRQSLTGWNRIRFELERLHVEHLRNNGALEDALQAARQLLRYSQDAGSDAYPGAAYDLARAHFQLGKLLKLAGAAEPAARAFSEARQRFQPLADAGNASAGRMVAMAESESGDCLSTLRRLGEAASAYEAALANASPDTVTHTVATDKLLLGLVRQRQGRYSEALILYDDARRIFETLGELEGAATAWRQLGLTHRLTGDPEAALQACQKAFYRYEHLHSHTGMAETLGDLGHLQQILNRPAEAAAAYRRAADLYAELGDNRSEEASRNQLANVLIQLRRHNEARQELYRASECSSPESPTVRNWSIPRGLWDVSQAARNPEIAEQARQMAIQKYLAYRRAGGENPNPGARLCAQVGQAIRSGDTAALAEQLTRITANPHVPADGKRLVAKLQAILAGERTPTLATDAKLHYQYSAELQLLLEELESFCL